MLTSGVLSAIMFLASLTAFIVGFYRVEYSKPMSLLGLALFAGASLLLAIKIRQRMPSEMN